MKVPKFKNILIFWFTIFLNNHNNNHKSIIVSFNRYFSDLITESIKLKFSHTFTTHLEFRHIFPFSIHFLVTFFYAWTPKLCTYLLRWFFASLHLYCLHKSKTIFYFFVEPLHLLHHLPQSSTSSVSESWSTFSSSIVETRDIVFPGIYMWIG